MKPPNIAHARTQGEVFVSNSNAVSEERMKTDKLGLPLTNGEDGGDSACIAGNLLVTGFQVPIQYYLMGEEPVRHPDQNKWYGRPGRFSRDQLVGMLCGMAIDQRNQWARLALFRMHQQRGFCLAWNKIRNHVYETYEEHRVKSTPDVAWNIEPKMPDICGPEVWALWIRVWRAWYLYPLLLILDLENFVGALHWRWFRDDNVARNHLLTTHVGRKVMPTPWSWLSYRLTPWADLKARWKKHCEACGEPYAMEGVGGA